MKEELERAALGREYGPSWWREEELRLRRSREEERERERGRVRWVWLWLWNPSFQNPIVTRSGEVGGLQPCLVGC